MFNSKITDYLSGVTGDCTFVMKNGIGSSPSCSRSNLPLVQSDLLPYQSLASAYLHPDTDHRGLLAYHGLGSGKTLVGIATMANFLQKEPQRTTIFVGKPSLEANFRKDLGKCSDEFLFGKKVSEQERARIISRQILYVTYEVLANKLSGETQWNLAVNKGEGERKPGSGLGTIKNGEKIEDSPGDPLLNNTLIVIDEAHNLIKQLSNPKYPNEEAAQVVLDAIRNATTCRLLFLTATPIQQESYEIAVLLNLLIPPADKTRFPEVFVQKSKNGHRYKAIDDAKTKAVFDATFFGKDQYGVTILKNAEKFVELAKGLVSYYPVDFNLAQFARVVFEPVTYVQMPEAFLQKYIEKRKKEVDENPSCSMSIKEQMEAKEAEEGDNLLQVAAASSGSTRGSSSGGGEGREGGEDDSESARGSSRNRCSSSLRYSIVSSTYKSEFASIKSMEEMKEKAPKCVEMAKTMDARVNKGKQMVFTGVDDIGLYALGKCLQLLGWTLYSFEDIRSMLKEGDTSALTREGWCKGACNIQDLMKKPLTQKKAFVMLNRETIEAYKIKVTTTLYNSLFNADGSYVNTILLNSKFSEGLSLAHMKAVHLMDPLRSTALQSQVIARAVRNCSHEGLKYPDEWRVSVYRYFMTTDSMLTIADFSNRKTTAVSPRGSVPLASSSSSSPLGQFFRLSGGGGEGAEGETETAAASTTTAAVSESTKKDLVKAEKKTKKTSSASSSAASAFADKCSQITDAGACSASEFCDVDDSGACRFLSTESNIAKNAHRQSKIIDDFLRLLRVAAVDCAIFKSMHDPNDPVTCGKAPTSSSGQKESILSQKARVALDLGASASSSSEASDDLLEKCAMHKNEDGCIKSSLCDFNKKSNRCVPKCSAFKNKIDCDKQTFCAYTSSGSSLLSASKTCESLYDRSTFLDFENAVAISTASRDSSVFANGVKVGELILQKQKLIPIDVLGKNIDNFMSKMKTLTSSKKLRFLKKFLEIEGSHPEISPKIDTLIQIIAQSKTITEKDQSFYTVMKLVNSRGQLQPAEFEFVSKELIDIRDIIAKNMPLNFMLHFVIGDVEYFISSGEIQELRIPMSFLKYHKMVSKEFVFFDLFVYLTFTLNGSSLSLSLSATKRADILQRFGKPSSYEVITLGDRDQ